MERHTGPANPAQECTALPLRQALASLQAGNPAQAELVCRSVLARTPRDPAALHLLGLSLAAQDRLDDALRSLSKAVALQPDYAEAHYNRGNVLRKLRRMADAIAAYDRVVSLRPDFAEAYNNRANALAQTRNFARALPDYDRAIALKPPHVDAQYNRASAFMELGRYSEALAAFDQVLALNPRHASAHNNRGIVLGDLQRHDEAAAAFARAAELQPDLPGAAGNAVFQRMLGCDWAAIPAAGEIVDRFRRRPLAFHPFLFLAVCDRPEDNLACARAFAEAKFMPLPPPLRAATPFLHQRLRVAYLSSDFHNHATSYLLARLLETHDRSQFEVLGIEIGDVQADAMSARIRGACDRFVDVSAMGDHEAAEMLRKLQVDIAVDLKGYTKHGRPGILAFRPAPIQINYLGHPGTMGAEWIDYILADATVIPGGDERFYREAVVRLPGSYQVNDSTRAIADPIGGRQALGLPDAGFVFCCFNSAYKITPAVFDIWMRLLAAVPGSVLWLFATNALAVGNLRREAAARGVAPERLVFAPSVPVAEHLARHRHADLVLDTLPYNAHTTTADALWAGVPVLTCIGTAFQGRVAASLLRAAGLPDLVTDSLGAYEAVALRYATDAAQLRAVKDKLARGRATLPLFDTDRFRRGIEGAYRTMWERYRRGEPVAAFDVA